MDCRVSRKNLRDAEPAAVRAVGELDLERVAGALHGREVDPPQHLAPETLEAAGEVPVRDAQDRAGVEAPSARERSRSIRPPRYAR